MKENILLFFKYLVFSLGYLILANVGHFSSVKPHEFVPFWLPGGLYVAILFLTKAKHWPLVVVAAVISNISFDLIDGKPFWLTSIFSLANSVDAVIGVWLFRKIKPSVPTFESPREVFLFLGFNVILSPGFSTTVCSGIISLKEGLPFWSIWITWWSGAAVGVILIAPLILILWQAIIKKNFLFTFFKKVEFITMLGVTIIISWLILSGIGNWMLSQKYLILFIFIWAIIRFGQVGVVCTNIIVAYTVVFCQTRYSSVLIWHSQLSPYQENTASQIFIFSMSFSSLLISSIISERNRSIKNLSLSESKFSSLINNASDVIFIHSLDGYLLEVNDEACRRLEYSKEELLKMRMRDIISPRFTEGVKSRIKNIVSKGHMFIEIEHMSKSGKIIPTEINATLIDYGKNKAILGIGRDLTDRLIAEKKLKENEERYRLVIKASNDGIWDWDIESDYVYYSPRWKQMIGYENHELENTLDTWIRTIHPDDLATARQLLKEHFEENKPYDFIARFFHKNGSLRWIQVKGFALRDENGKPFRMIGNHTDITDKKLAEDELRESQLRFRVAFLTSPDAININRLSDGMYIDINEGFTRLSGWTKDEIIGRTSLEINIWGSGEDRIKLVRALKKDGICDNLEAQFRGKDGSLRTCLMSAQLIDLHGEHCILSITRDITDLKITKRQILEKNATIEEQNKVLKESFERIQTINEELTRARDKAEESDRLKSAFLANMSHEIRTPLNSILGFSDLINSKELPTEKRKKYAQIIKQRGTDLLSLINDLLDISKIEAGQMVISNTSGNLRDLFEELYQSFEYRDSGENPNLPDFTYSFSLPEGYHDVILDFNHLKQIMINLIGNAFKFTTHGYIEFGCSLASDHEILFYVKDTGAGIPEDKQEIIFERFRQIKDNYLTNEIGGTGLGLAIVKALVELQKGKLWLHSLVGKGSTFYFTLPYQPAKSDSRGLNVPAKRTYDWKDKVVLIVEDDKYNAAYLAEVLKETKIRYYIASSGMQAIEMVKTKPEIEMVLMDIRLPDMSGLDAVEQIIMIKPKVRVIAQTAYAAEEDRLRALESGCCDYISKPLNPAKLLSLMNKHFKSAQTD